MNRVKFSISLSLSICRILKVTNVWQDLSKFVEFAFRFGMITMIVCNETISASVEKFPIVVETALQDLNDYHSSTTIQLRKCLSRSLDVASEAILADLDSEWSCNYIVHVSR